MGDKQVLKGELDTFCLLLPFDSSSETRDFERHRVHRHIAAKPFDELKPPLPLLLRFGAVRSVNKLGNTDNGHSDLQFGLSLAHLF
jgi:hypothetical protein